MKRQESSGDRDPSSDRKKMKTRRRGGGSGIDNGDFAAEDEEDEDEEEEGSGDDYQPPTATADPEVEAVARRQEQLRKTIQEMLRTRKVGETFLQDGPCYQVRLFTLIFLFSFFIITFFYPCLFAILAGPFICILWFRTHFCSG